MRGREGIGHEQAHNIVAGFRQSKVDKPLSHDLMISILKAGNLQLDRVIIDSIEDNAFHAVLKLRLTEKDDENHKQNSPPLLEIDARPSDAIALAVRTKCAIWMFEKVVAMKTDKLKFLF